MPVLFASSGAVAAASFLDLFYDNEAGRRVTRVFGSAARVVELAASHQVEQSASRIPRVGAPFRRGRSALLWRAAEALTAASLVFSLSRKARVAGVLGVAGSLLLRFAIHEAGNVSATDPRASFRQQRQRATAPARTLS